MHKKLLFIGGGNMARSLVGGLVADGYAPEAITVSEPDAQKRANLEERFAVHATAETVPEVEAAAAVVVAVKPSVVRHVIEEIAEAVRARGAAGDPPLIISVAAGVRMRDLERWLGGKPTVVRTMPNTPSLVGSGATALAANARVTEEQRDLAESLMRAVGATCWLPDEEMLDAVTAISGSGPAYFFLLMEALEEAGVELGLDRQTARLLTLETATGAARMALESSEGPAQLRARVTSPGGTTERAMDVLEEGQVRELVRRAATAASQRAEELGQMLGEQ